MERIFAIFDQLPITASYLFHKRASCAMKRGEEIMTTASPYTIIDSAAQPIERHTLAIKVDNEPGVLARVIGLFSGRGYNIESLTVSEIDAENHQSRITIVTTGTAMVIEQIKAQLERLVPVHGVRDLTIEGPHVERELALIKVSGVGEKRVESLRIAELFRARVLDAALDSFVFEMTGTTDKLNAFIDLMVPLGLVDVSRTGIVAISRGNKSF